MAVMRNSLAALDPDDEPPRVPTATARSRVLCLEGDALIRGWRPPFPQPVRLLRLYFLKYEWRGLPEDKT